MNYCTTAAKKLLLSMLFLCALVCARAQQLKKAEYFFDTDPGIGKGVQFALPNARNIDSTLNFNVSALPNGLHSVYVRAQDTSGKWSVGYNASFIKSAGGAVASINYVTRVEYFFDADPGFGKGTEIYTNSTKATIDSTFPFSVSSLANGLHTLYVRALDINQNWSLAYSASFIKSAGGAASSINYVTRVEYFFDADPGIGKGTDIYTNSTKATVDSTYPFSVSSLTTGLHTLYVRALDINQNWSLAYSSSFVKEIGYDTSFQAISNVEYFLDSDPGVGKGTPLPVVAAPNIDDTFSIQAPYNGDSTRTLYMRAADRKGNWSLYVNPATVYPTGIDSVSVSSTVHCPADSITVTAKVTGGSTPGNLFTAWLSDSSGSFAKQTAIGTLAANPVANPKGSLQTITIKARLPYPLINGLHYRVRVTGSAPADTSILNSQYMQVLKPGPGNDTSIVTCPGTSVNLTTLYNTAGLNVRWNITNPTSVTAAGNDTLFVSNNYGCKDTAVITIAHYATAITQNISLSGCNDVVYNGVTYTASIVVRDTVKSIHSCDSVYNVVIITVTKVTPVTQTTNVSGCNSAVYNGVTYTSSVNLRDTVRSWQGCDSVYKIAVITVSKITSLTQNIALSGCNSVVYNGVTYTSSTVNRDTLRSIYGCDSIYKVATITVTKITPVTQNITLSGCKSVVYNGVTYAASTTVRDTLRSVQGCDSIYKVAAITVSTTVPPVPVLSKTGATSFCIDDSVVITTTSTGPYQWLRNNAAIENATSSRYAINIPGVYKLKVVATGGCYSVSDSISATVAQVPTPTITEVNDTLVSSAAVGNQWFLSDLPITGATSEKYLPYYLGYYTVQVTGNNCVSIMSNPYLYTANTPGKIVPYANMKVLLYPNPAQDAAKLQITGSKGNVMITITDMAGKKVWQQENLLDGTNTLQLANLANGLYIVTIRDATGIVTTKLVKAK